MITVVLFAALWTYTLGFAPGEQIAGLVTELSIDDDLQETSDVQTDSLTAPGNCMCSMYGCYCTGSNNNVTVRMLFSVDRIRHRRHYHTVIDTTFLVQDTTFTHFVRIFQVNRFRSFCKYVMGKRYCFGIKSSVTSDSLSGCLRLFIPTNVDIGCFVLPLKPSDENEMNSNDDTVANIEAFVGEVESALKEVSNVIESAVEDILRDIVEVPAVTESAEDDITIDDFQLDDIDQSADEANCSCTNFGCSCDATENGVKVSVVLSVNELNHGKHKCTVIQGFFQIADVSFTKRFKVNRFDDFCHRVNRVKYCFRIDVEDNKKGNTLRGCIGILKPHKMELGCFSLPLMT